MVELNPDTYEMGQEIDPGELSMAQRVTVRQLGKKDHIIDSKNEQAGFMVPIGILKSLLPKQTRLKPEL